MPNSLEPGRLPLAYLEEPEEVRTWLFNAEQHGGRFLHSFAAACQAADSQNYPILRPALLQLIEKYPTYGKAYWTFGAVQP